LFSALNATQDKRKGYIHVIGALGELRKSNINEKCELAILGSDDDIESEIEGFKVHNLGKKTRDEDVVNAYRAVDAVIFPTERDNLPNIVKEASACGTPSVSFDVGGLPDMIEHLRTGYLAKPYDRKDLAAGVLWVLENSGKQLSGKVRRSAQQKHDPGSRVSDYLNIYERLKIPLDPSRNLRKPSAKS